MKYNFNNMLIDFDHGKEFYSDFSYRDLIAYNDIYSPAGPTPKEKPFEDGYLVIKYPVTGKDLVVDPKNKYIPNSDGYRSPEIDKADIVFSGCSHTYGVGVPEHMIWGVQVAKSLGYSYMNLAGNGQSSYFAIQNILAYIKKYGPPKIVMMLLPNLSRFLAPNSPAYVRSVKYRNLKDRLPGKDILSAISTNNWDTEEDFDINKRAKIQKVPFLLEDFLYPELSYYITLQHLNSLEMLCSALNIKLLWGTWNKENNNLYKSLSENRKDYYNSYVDLESFQPGNINALDYCQQHENLRHANSHCFDLGGDKEWDGDPLEEHGHAGVHLHTHWAESFLENLNI